VKDAFQKQTSVTLPGAVVSTLLPKGWTLEPKRNRVLTIVGPEGDLRVGFGTTSMRGDAEEVAWTAWQQFDTSFDLPVLQRAQAPGENGWDEVFQIVYNTPAVESRSAIAILRTLRDKAYFTLLSGTKASLDRRLAQISEVLEAWKPEGLVAYSLDRAEPRPWGKEQSFELSSFVRNAMVETQIPGVAIAVVQGGSVVYADGFGTCRLGSSEPVRPQTRFMIGSATKPLTTLMMARLVANGNFAWHTPVTEFLPDFALADPEITRELDMRYTVCACTGMPRRDLDLIFKFKGISPEQRIAEMRTMSPTTDFGETFQYSNYLVAVGGYAAARSLQPEGSLQFAYEEAMQEWVFEPLGMTMTDVPEEMTKDMAAPHALGFGGNCSLVSPGMERFVNAVAPAGALWSTVLDMAQYLLLELNRGKTPNGDQLLPAEDLQARWRGGIKIDGKNSYGLGLLRSDEEGLEVISHSGNTLGFSSDLYFLPKKGLGVVVLTNLRLANAFLAAARHKVFELVFGDAPKAEKMIAAASLSANDVMDKMRTRVKVDPDSVAWLEAFEGKYRSDELGTLVLSKKNDQYWGQFESWNSLLGVEDQSAGNPLIVLISPPWSGTLRMQVADDRQILTLDSGQISYKFHRQ
jgi:CubicO group peptidase (beta-lactamase class C family)